MNARDPPIGDRDERWIVVLLVLVLRAVVGGEGRIVAPSLDGSFLTDLAAGEGFPAGVVVKKNQLFTPTLRSRYFYTETK